MKKEVMTWRDELKKINPKLSVHEKLLELNRRKFLKKPNGTLITIKDISVHLHRLKTLGKKAYKKRKPSYEMVSLPNATTETQVSSKAALILGSPSQIAEVLKGIA